MSGESVGRFEWEQALRETPGVSMPLRGVLSLMATYATFKTGEDIRPSLTRVAEDLGIHRSTLTKHVGKGVRLEWLGCTEDNDRQGKPSVYQLTRPTGGEANMRHPLTLPPVRGEANMRHPLPLPDQGGEANIPHPVPQICAGGEANIPHPVPQIFRTTYGDTSASTSPTTSTPMGASAWDEIERQDKAKAQAREDLMAKAPPFD